MSSANFVLFLTVLLSLSCLSAVLGQGSCDAKAGNTGPSCDFRCDAGSFLLDCGTWALLTVRVSKDVASGTAKTDKTSCERSGCCWNPYLPPGNPKCFRKNGGYAYCDNTLAHRVPCSKGASFIEGLTRAAVDDVQVQRRSPKTNARSASAATTIQKAQRSRRAFSTILTTIPVVLTTNESNAVSRSTTLLQTLTWTVDRTR